MLHRETQGAIDVALSAWRRAGRPLDGALVYGSHAFGEKTDSGSDLDLAIVTPTPPAMEWFAERDIGSVTVEIFPIWSEEIRDAVTVIDHISLPFALCHGLILCDPHGILRAVREKLAPSLCAAVHRRKRAGQALEQCGHALRRARDHWGERSLPESRRAVVNALWHLIGVAPALECRSPTMRKGFVELTRLAERSGDGELVRLAQLSLGQRALTPEAASRLTADAAAIRARHRHSIEPLLAMGHHWQAAWPLLSAAVLAPETSESKSYGAQIISALGYATSANVADRLTAIDHLHKHLHDVVDATIPPTN